MEKPNPNKKSILKQTRKINVRQFTKPHEQIT